MYSSCRLLPKSKDYRGKKSASGITLRIALIILLWSGKIKQNMSGNCCDHCQNPLSTELVFRRACCEGCFHQQCIESLYLIHCLFCRLDSLRDSSRILLWILMVSLLIDGNTDQSPAKRWRVGDGETSITCLQEFTQLAKVVTPKSCCK